MTYMAGIEGEYYIECQAFPGAQGDASFTKRENVYFLGKNQVTGTEASYLGFPGYFKINESPVAIVSGFDVGSNILSLVSPGTDGQGIFNSQMANFRARGICIDDIVVGARSNAVRKIGVNFKNYNDGNGNLLKTGIKEIGYTPSFYDLLDFTQDDRAISYNRSRPHNLSFYKDTIFENKDLKFSCLSLSDRFELPVPYTTNQFGFNLATAVTPIHIFMSAHIAPYSPNHFQFWDSNTERVVTRTVVKKHILADSDFGLYASNDDNNGIAINSLDVAICLLDSPIPSGIVPAFVPDVAYRDSNSSYLRRMDCLMIDQTMRGYYLNAIRGGRVVKDSVNNSVVEGIDPGVVNSQQFKYDMIAPASCPISLGVGDSNSMYFTCIDNKLVLLGSLFGGVNSQSGLAGTWAGEPYYSYLNSQFTWYPNADGLIVNSPVNRYRDDAFGAINSRFWMTIGNKALRYLFTSKSIWGVDIDPAFVPSRIKITNDINIVEPATEVNVAESNLIGRKIKFIS